ncbi:transketolase C-terminal domain-containing protein [Bradyrhizobium sp. A5]|uniref:transketolase family protein n=1 Tax=Bradyrhizobium sp. A5 TaxID=3133696 RepID=UPI0032463D24
MRKSMMLAITDHAECDPGVVFLTGDLGFSVVEPVAELLGPRFINAGVAEQNMISVAAGLAASGLKPYCYSIAPFVTARCYEQIRNDIGYEGRQVILVGAGAGLSYGSLGPSHHSLDDASLLSGIPGMAVLSPANGTELAATHAALIRSGQAGYIRVAREDGPDFATPSFSGLSECAHRLGEGKDVTLVASGPAVMAALDAARQLAERGVRAGVVSVPVLSPFPIETLDRILGPGPIVAVFEGYTGNPLELGLRRLLMGRQSSVQPFDEISVPLRFPKLVGSTEALRRDFRIDAPAIVERVLLLLAAK